MASRRHCPQRHHPRNLERNLTIEATELGVVHVPDRWAAISGRARVSTSESELPFRVIVDANDPRHPGPGVLSLTVEGLDDITVPLDPNTATITASTRR